MRILIAVPHQDRVSGNWVSASRYQLGLKEQGHQVTLHDTRLQEDGAFREQLLSFEPDVVLLLHAYRTGKPWLQAAVDLNIPYLVLLTGTDVNHGLDDPEQREVIRTVMHQAAFALLQNPLLADELAAREPALARNLRILTPGIILGRTPYDLRKTHRLAEDTSLFLCPAGLRPVKGVLELLEMFDQVASESSACHLAVCGPILDEQYGRRFLAAIKQRPWASYLGAIPPQAMTGALRGADVILNNSATEGLANALLEAASLGLPILARNIPGNAAVVRHGINGLLYTDETEFVRYARQLLNKSERLQLTCPEPERYHPAKETAELIALLHDALKLSS